MDENEEIRSYKDRLRVFLILYIFSDPFSDPQSPKIKRLFTSEQRIQKIDFLLRNPDYLSYELLNIAKEEPKLKEEIKVVIKGIFENNEPTIRRLEMEKFFFGAYEDIDDVIAFLTSIEFVKFTSRKNINLNTIEKKYFITQSAIDKFESSIDNLPSIKWYVERCKLIKKYFGDLSGNKLRILQYQIDEYRNTSYNEYIKGVKNTVKSEFYKLYSVEI